MIVYTYSYDAAYHGPPLPVVEIEVGVVSQDEHQLLLTGVVDSGADATMIPSRYLRQLGAAIVDRRYMIDNSGLRYPVDIYAVSLRVGPYAQGAVEVISNRFTDDVIVGRDILNHMIVTLNGLALAVEISQP